MKIPLTNREISWLHFNERVLQEAADETVPLVERLRFLGIYSNNMDEFYRVRVANLRRLSILKKNQVDGYSGGAENLYKEIRKIALLHQEQFRSIYAEIILKLEDKGYRVRNEKEISESQLRFLTQYYQTKIKQEIFPIILKKNNEFPKLRDYSIYLAIRIQTIEHKVKFALIQIPSDLGRFIILPKDEFQDVILIDDVIRLNLKEIFSIFNPQKIEAFTFKFTRDAELNLDDDLSISYIEKIQQSLKKRKVGQPVRFVYDREMPQDMLNVLLSALKLKFGLNTIPGGRYHNFKDFMNFPDFNDENLVFEQRIRNNHANLHDKKSIIQEISKKDILLHYPYQRFEHIIDLLREAAIDPQVTRIKINVYRVAKNSDIMKALLAAVFNGKEVTVVMELQARFDEENNVYWSNRLTEFGAKVIHGVQGIKIHSKLLWIERKTAKTASYISHIGTGNFNEVTSKIYTDLSFLTANKNISQEIKALFDMMENKFSSYNFKRLIVSPINARLKLFYLIQQEINNAKNNIESYIHIKINNITDKGIISKLYEASQAGVKIKLIVRGICCLEPGLKKISENIEAINTVDRYLEHSRFFIFSNKEKPIHIITSADLMERNLDHRIEVGIHVQTKSICEELEKIFNTHWEASDKTSSIVSNSPTRLVHRNLPYSNAQKELFKYYSIKLNQSLTL